MRCAAVPVVLLACRVLLLTALDILAVLLLAMEEFPEPARRRDRFLIQAAWSEDSDVDVPERVRTAHIMHTDGAFGQCM